MSSGKIKINIQYCGGWGYKRYYDALVIALEKEFPSEIQCSFTKDPGATGNFEVTLVESKTLIHSKKAGAGRCESEAERSALFEKIREYKSSL